MVLDQVSITRSELLSHKQQLELTRQGYDLLDKKRLALLQEISSLQEQVVERAVELQNVSNQSRRSLAMAEAQTGTGGFRVPALGYHSDPDIRVLEKKVMGVKIQRLDLSKQKGVEDDHDLGLASVSPVVMDAVQSFDQSIDAILRLADSELQLGALMNEIVSTTRRIKALEHIVIPRLEAEYHHIRMMLEERERAEHFSRKLAKKLSERREME